MKPTILALDLEGTLISNAISQIPVPGLYWFLEEIHALFDQLAMFTTVPEDRFRSIAALLAREGSAPAWFMELPLHQVVRKDEGSTPCLAKFGRGTTAR